MMIRRRNEVVFPFLGAFSRDLSYPPRMSVQALLLAPPARRVALAAPERARRRHDFFLRLKDEVFRHQPFSVVHVAGTKGKGSVCELVRAASEIEGKMVGCFTSPHLHSCRERIRVRSDPISADALDRCGRRALEMLESSDDWGAVFFDRLLAAALIYFAEKQCPLVVLEAGIGGLYDTTNFTRTDDVAIGVITSISRDHTALLGETLGEIATHKAGIMRPGKLTLTPARQAPEALEALVASAEKVGARLETVPGSTPHEENLALATRASQEILGIEQPDFSRAKWPARFELLEPRDSERRIRTVLVDSAHNGDSAYKLFQHCRRTFSDKTWTLVFGCGQEKEGLDDMITAIRDNADLFDQVLLVEAYYGTTLPPSKTPASAHELASKLKSILLPSLDENIVVVNDPPSIRASLDRATSQHRKVLVFGSLYVSAEAREWAVSDFFS